MERSAIVVGGGIGGLAAALGLAQAGWKVDVYERAERFAPVGAGLALEPNAVKALDWLGVGGDLRARGMRQGSTGLRTAGGRWLVRMKLEDLEQRFETPAFVLHRADVHQTLLDGLGEYATVSLHTGRAATGVAVGGDRAEVAFDGPDGPVTAQADLVVGADGVHSAVRGAVFPDHAQPGYAGYVTWRGVVPADDANAAELNGAAVETWGRGRRVGVIPLPDGRAYWFFAEVTPEGSQQQVTVADLVKRVHDWHAPIPQLLAATPQQALLRNDIYTLLTPLPSYRRGRVVLLGDAAHAITPDLGQGAALAVEDAVVLAAETGGISTEADLDAALDRYDRQRRPRTQKLVRISARVGQIAGARHPLAAAVRDLVAGLIPKRVFLRAMSGALGWTPPRQPRPARHR